MANKHTEQIMQYIKDSKKKEKESVLLSELIKNNGDMLTQDTKSKIKKILSGGSYNEQAIASVVERFDPSKIGTFEVIIHDNVEMSCGLPMEGFPYEETGNVQYLILHTENGAMVRKISQCLLKNEGTTPITAVEYMWLDASKLGVTFKNSLAYASTEKGYSSASNTIFGYNEGYKTREGLWNFDYKATNDENYSSYDDYYDWSAHEKIRIDEFINCNPSVQKTIKHICEVPGVKPFLLDCARKVVQPCYNMQQTFNTIARQMGVSESLLTDITGEQSKAYVENIKAM